MVINDTSEYQNSSIFSKGRLYTGINNEDESINYAYNEPFYASIFSYCNAAFNIKIDKFNTYRSYFTKTPILDTYIYKLDLNRITYSGIKISPNKVI